MGVYMGMGNHMGKVEIDDRGRLTLPSKIREKLFIKSGNTEKSYKRSNF
jgi:bifunctional DNA-binding transcriptional regulator/antitoxin component of YhaV-PrlF toxin-antitoxin module